MVFTSFFVCFLLMWPFSFRRFCWCLAVPFDPKKQNTNRHVSRSMSPKLSAPHSISPWRLRWLFQMRNIWNLRSKPQDLRSKPHQINGNLQDGGVQHQGRVPPRWRKWVVTVPNDGLSKLASFSYSFWCRFQVKHAKLWEGKAVDGQKILRSARLEVAVQVRLLHLLQV